MFGVVRKGVDFVSNFRQVIESLCPLMFTSIKKEGGRRGGEDKTSAYLLGSYQYEESELIHVGH